MATTRLISMHQNKGKSIAQCLSDRTDYTQNPDKTNDGKLISSYECDPRTVQGEFMLSKRQYHQITGREQTNDVIAYQIRQSFKPGEITPELANQIGYELGLKWTKGKYAFIVATHVDKAHIHNHIIYNSTSLDCNKKFRDFLGSGRAVGKISDRICLEYGLSIIENPKRGKTNYGKWLGNKKVPSCSDKIRETIDAVLAKKPTDFNTFLLEMQAAGYKIKQGKHISFLGKDQKKPIRFRSLGEGYSEDEIRAAIKGIMPLTSKRKPTQKPMQRVNLLVDIQEKLQAGKEASYERWAKVFNLKQMAQTINFLSENNLLAYEDLEQKSQTTTATFNELSTKIKTAETRMHEIAVLKTHIINYTKTRDTYTAYRKAGYSKKFYEEHTADLLLHKAAKEAFDELGIKKLPTVKILQSEYAELLSSKKKTYVEYLKAKKEMQEVFIAKTNIDYLLGKDAFHSKKKNHSTRDNLL